MAPPLIGAALDRDPDDEDGEQGSRRVLVHVKSNVGPLERSLIYEVVPATVEGDISTARLEEVGESDLGGNELLARNGSRLGERRQATRARRRSPAARPR